MQSCMRNALSSSLIVMLFNNGYLSCSSCQCVWRRAHSVCVCLHESRLNSTSGVWGRPLWIVAQIFQIVARIGASRCVYVTKLFLTALWVLSCYISFSGTPGLFVLCLCHLKNKSWKEIWRGVQKIKVSLWDRRFIELVSQRLESHTHLAGKRTLRTACSPVRFAETSYTWYGH